MERVLDAASTNYLTNDETVKVVPDVLLFHHFSVGGFLYGQALRAMADQPERYGEIRSKIRAQIFDSPPDFLGIPAGVSRSMGIGSPFQEIIEFSIRTYLKLNENTSGVGHRASSAAFHGNDVRAPSLWYYSKADPVADWKDCEIVIEKWKAKGTDVEQCVWDNTPHIQHARYDPEKYFGTLERFLKTNNII